MKNHKKHHRQIALYRILIFLVLFVVSLCVREVFSCSIMFGITVIYGLLCGFSIKGMINSFVKILPFLLLFSIFQLMFHPALPDEVRLTKFGKKLRSTSLDELPEFRKDGDRGC